MNNIYFCWYCTKTITIFTCEVFKKAMNPNCFIFSKIEERNLKIGFLSSIFENANEVA